MITEWYKAESAEEEQPLDIDNTSSEEYVYVRKDFKHVEVEPMHDEEDVTYKWVYMEQKVSKDDWNTYVSIINAQKAITVSDGGLMDIANIVSDHDGAITELAEIVSNLAERIGE